MKIADQVVMLKNTSSNCTGYLKRNHTLKFELSQVNTFSVCLAGLSTQATWSIEGFRSRDLYTKVKYFEGVAAQENNNSDSKRLFA